MNCEFVSDNIRSLAAQSLVGDDRLTCMAHIESCPDCRAALRGAEALVELRRRETGNAPAELFNQVLRTATADSHRETSKRKFWLGTGFGGLIAASVFTLALVFGWADGFRSAAPAAAEFMIAVDQPRQMNLAFETDRRLQGATISILLSGSVEIEGYGMQRELSWTEDLDAGVNRLSLPVLANGIDGGQMVVRMTHPQSEQIFVVNLPAES